MQYCSSQHQALLLSPVTSTTGYCFCFGSIPSFYYYAIIIHVFSSVQLLSHVQLFATPWIAARQAFLSITNCWSSLKLMSIELVMPSSHFILCCPLFFLPSILPASGSFPMSQLFAWCGQSTVVSALASFLPKNTQGWSPLEWTSWIQSICRSGSNS